MNEDHQLLSDENYFFIFDNADGGRGGGTDGGLSLFSASFDNEPFFIPN